MGPQPGAEDNLPKDDGDASEEDLPRIPDGTFLGGMRGDDVGTSDDEDQDERVQVGGYQLLGAEVDAQGDEDSDDSDDEDEVDNRDIAESNVNSGWARFDEMPANENSHANSRLDVDWASAGSESLAADSVGVAFDSVGVASDSDDPPLPPPPPPDSSDADFLAGGAYLLPANLRDVPPPRVASLSEGVRQVWAGRRPAEAGEASSRSMGKVDDIRKAMAKITLPNTAVPDWANQLSDEEWRKALDERLNLSKK